MSKYNLSTIQDIFNANFGYELSNSNRISYVYNEEKLDIEFSNPELSIFLKVFDGNIENDREHIWFQFQEIRKLLIKSTKKQVELILVLLGDYSNKDLKYFKREFNDLERIKVSIYLKNKLDELWEGLNDNNFEQEKTKTVKIDSDLDLHPEIQESLIDSFKEDVKENTKAKVISGDFTSILNQVLVNEFDLNLGENARIETKDGFTNFDLYDDQQKVLVKVHQLKPKSGASKETILKSIESQMTVLQELVKSNWEYYLVFSHTLDPEDKNFFLLSLLNVYPNVKFSVFDLRDIVGISEKNGLLLPESFELRSKFKDETTDSDLLLTQKENEVSQSINEIKFNSITNKTREFWMGAYDATKKKKRTFIVDGTWENKGGKKNNSINTCQLGDIIFLKTHRSLYEVIESVGVIMDNPKDARSLVVNWYEFEDSFEFDLNFSNRIFRKLDDDSLNIILHSIINTIPDFTHVINSLIPDVHKSSIIVDEPGHSKERTTPIHKQQFTSIYSDADLQGTDLLDIEKDVRSFALLLASEQVKPPVAVALFGSWGSGKSFFMETLMKRVDELSTNQGFLVDNPNNDPIESTSAEDNFCKGIAQIKFNAWSYLDANLWAGLAHSLFEKLNEYIKDQIKSDVERVKVETKIAKHLDYLHTLNKEYKDKKQDLVNLKEQLEEEKENKMLRFFSSHYDQTILDFLTKNGWEEEQAKRLTPSKLRAKVKSGINKTNWLKLNSSWLLQVFIAVAVCSWLLIQSIGDLTNVWTEIMVFLAPIGTVLVPFMKFISKKKTVFADLDKAVEDFENAKKKKNKDGVSLDAEINEINELISGIEDTLEKEYYSGEAITRQAIEDFVAETTEKEAYQKELGIISAIRKDFETLSQLFSSLESEKGIKPELKEDRKEIAEIFGRGKKLDRIILYIDDLDRCSDEKVMEVLQAVHLLMAFPLFNVVVGVDKRCVYNAIYHRQVKSYGAKLKLKDLEQEGIKLVSPDEYLEKIFQIPFHLESVKETGVQSMIDHLLKDQVVVDDELEFKNVVSESTENYKELTKEEQEEVQKELEEEQEKNLIEFHKELEEKEKLQEQERSLVEKEILRDVMGPPHYSFVGPPDDLKFSKTELEYLKEFAWLIGDTPRTIKRFVNIYRVIRAHESTEENREENQQSHLRLIFLLALFSGKYKSYSPVFCLSLESKYSKDYDLSFVLLDRDHLKNDEGEIIDPDNIQGIIYENISSRPMLKSLLEEKVVDFTSYKFIQRFTFSEIKNA